MSDVEPSSPPAGEDVHLPGPTLLPFISAIAITLTVIGTTLGWLLSALGLIVLIVCVVIWVRDVRRDVSELPEDHL